MAGRSGLCYLGLWDSDRFIGIFQFQFGALLSTLSPFRFGSIVLFGWGEDWAPGLSEPGGSGNVAAGAADRVDSVYGN